MRLPARQSQWAFFLACCLFALMIGLRHEVGGDWLTYLPHFDNDRIMSLDDILGQPDPAYHFVDWIAAKSNFDIYAVNLVCAALLMVGTFSFCRTLPNSWLALLVSVPYMLIVVGMGYTRQSAALGFTLLGLAKIKDNKILSFVLFVSLGALFHKSAILLIPISALATTRNRVFVALLAAATCALLYYLLLVDAAETMWINYVEREMESEGGAVRVAMNAVPAILMLLLGRYLTPDPLERRLWLWVAGLALLCVPLVGMASTAVDRVALYFIPIQLFVFSHLPRLAPTSTGRTALVLAIVVYYGAVEFVWLHYATHAQYWLPYQFMPLN